MASTVYLGIGNDEPVWWGKDSPAMLDGVATITANVTAVLKSPAGATLGTITLAYDSALGYYNGFITASMTSAQTAGTSGTLTYTMTDSGKTGQYGPLTAKFITRGLT